MSGAPLPKAESLVLTSDEVNYLIYRYLQEGGESWALSCGRAGERQGGRHWKGRARPRAGRRLRGRRLSHALLAWARALDASGVSRAPSNRVPVATGAGLPAGATPTRRRRPELGVAAAPRPFS